MSTDVLVHEVPPDTTACEPWYQMLLHHHRPPPPDAPASLSSSLLPPSYRCSLADQCHAASPFLANLSGRVNPVM